MSDLIPSFNVAVQPWIAVVAPEGPTEVSIADALRRAPELTGLATADPLTVLPTIRLLVAVILRTHDLRTAQDIERLWDAGRFDLGAVEAYLGSHEGCFEVFHPERPFLQVAGLTPTSGLPKSAAGLQLHVASGNNVPLFSAVSDGDDVVLGMSAAVRSLLALLAYDTAAIKTGAQGDPAASAGKTTGNPTGPLGQLGAIIPWGRSLFDTLLLNVPLVPREGHDVPVWERTLTPRWEVRAPTGILDLLVWPSRRVRLIASADGAGVSGVIVAAGDRMALLPPHLEPHCRWRDTKGRGAGVSAQRPIRWQPGGHAWRGLDSLLALEFKNDVQTSNLVHQLTDVSEWLEWDYPLNALCVGVTYGNQSAVIEDVFVDSLPVPLAALTTSDDAAVRAALDSVANSAEQVRRALNSLADNLRVIEGGDKLPWDAGVHPGNDAMTSLTVPTLRLLRGLQGEPDRLDAGLQAWQATVETLAWSVAAPMLDAAPPAAFLGRDVKVGSAQRRVRLADVEAWFRSSLHRALDLRPANPTPERSAS